MGIRASSTCELILEDCEVPQDNVLGEVGKGYKVAIETLNEGRIGIGAQMIGLTGGALQYALDYSKERQAFGEPIAAFQGIQFPLARLPPNWKLYDYWFITLPDSRRREPVSSRRRPWQNISARWWPKKQLLK